MSDPSAGTIVPSRLSFDIGGTFTDFVLQDGKSGELRFWKALSTHRDPSRAVADGIEQLLTRSSMSAGEIDGVLHATTVATNAILERKGARTALVTTKGFRDTLLIGRQKRYDTEDLRSVRQEPLIRRRDIFELDERTLFDGKVFQAPSADDVRALALELKEHSYQAIAISLLHAYANPAHERALAAAIAEVAPDICVSISSDVSPKVREYERTSTTVANAYIQPLVKRYIAQLTRTLNERGLRSSLMIMQSNGGLISPTLASDIPIRIVESGPAAGVLMCRAVGQQEGISDLLTFDMGGTTAKLGAIDKGEPATLPTFEVDQAQFTKGSGLPLSISAIEMLEIAAGGGSIARLDLGMIVVGPKSAGSEPGPICYGRGGTQPTVTDANAVLGYLNPSFFNGGRMGLAVDEAAKGIEAVIGRPAGLELPKAAWSIHRMATANMERALRIVSVERGRDPRRYGLVGFGGAGPLHAARLARQVGIPTVIIPYGAGLGSAIGLLQAAPKLDHSITRIVPLARGIGDIAGKTTSELADWARVTLAKLGNSDVSGGAVFRYGATARYQGQGHEVFLDLPTSPEDEQVFMDEFSRAFSEGYSKLYGFDNPDRPIEIIDWSISAVVPGLANSQPLHFPAKPAQTTAPRTRRAYFPERGGYIDCPIYNRAELGRDREVVGPAVIEEAEATSILLPGDRARISPNGNLIIVIGSKEPQ